MSIFLFILLTLGFGYAYLSDHVLTKEAFLSNYKSGLVLLDRNGNEFFKFNELKMRYYIPLAKIPKNLQQAVIASEDHDFYNHNGLSLKAIGRSLLKNIEEQGYAQGGSTITQQLVKNILLNSDKRLFRKYLEVFLAQHIETKYSKDEILEMYLNTIYFGESAFGIQQAAHTYFNKDVEQLSLAESSMLVAVLPAPTLLSPVSGSYAEALKRQNIVLEKMVEQGYLSVEQKDEALKQPLDFQREKIVKAQQRNERIREAARFAVMIKDELEKEYGPEETAQSKFVIKTSFVLNKTSITPETTSVVTEIDLDEAIMIAKQLGISTIKRSSENNLSFVIDATEMRLLDPHLVDTILTNQGINLDPKLLAEMRDKTKGYTPSLVVQVGLAKKNFSVCGPAIESSVSSSSAYPEVVGKIHAERNQKQICDIIDGSSNSFTVKKKQNSPVADNSILMN